jgi:hypothetical protein
MIIQELLEILINSNQIGLEISEIEGDAILFYKFGEKPDLQELYGQVEKMFCDFTHHLIIYDQHRYCQCTACDTAINLSLKIISHYGEFTSYKVKDFTKLIGKDIIVAHQLLKNEIDQHEYWLVTNNLQSAQPGSMADWMKWNISAKKTENGNIPFHYTRLTELKNNISVMPMSSPDMSGMSPVFSLSHEYNTGIITLFHAAGDFSYRSRWMENIISVEDVPHNLPRVGMKCRCITPEGKIVITSTGYSFTDTTIEFSETNHADGSMVVYFLEKIEAGKTHLTITYYIRNIFLNEFLFKLRKENKIKSLFIKSMDNLEPLAAEIIIPGLPGI